MKLFEFAVEPDVMRDFSDCRLIASHMGLRARRMISAYPTKKRWKKWVLEQSALSGGGERELAKHQELIRSLDRVLLEADRSYDYEKQWLPNALDQQENEETRFDGVVATRSPDDRPDVLTIPEINGENSVWNPAREGLDPLWIADELGGDISGFGKRFWELVASSP